MFQMDNEHGSDILASHITTPHKELYRHINNNDGKGAITYVLHHPTSVSILSRNMIKFNHIDVYDAMTDDVIASKEVLAFLDTMGDAYVIAYLARLKNADTLVGYNAYINAFIYIRNEIEGKDNQTPYTEVDDERFLLYSDIPHMIYEPEDMFTSACQSVVVLDMMDCLPQYKNKYDLKIIIYALFCDVATEWSDEFMHSLSERNIERLMYSMHAYMITSRDPQERLYDMYDTDEAFDTLLVALKQLADNKHLQYALKFVKRAE